MKRRNKTVALLLAGVLAMSLLAGCGSSGNGGSSASSGQEAAGQTTGNDTADTASGEQENEPTEENAVEGEKTALTMMVWGNLDDYTPDIELFMEMSPEFSEKYDIQVELGGGGDADVAEKFRLMLASGEELPDMIRLNYTQFPEFADAGVLYDLADAIAPYENDIIDAAKDIMKWDGTYYAMIREAKPKIWVYRKDIFEDCGVDPAQVKTLDDFLAAAKTIHDKYPDSYIENYGTPLNNYDLTMMLCATGGTFCDEEGNYHCATDEGVRKAFENLKKLHDCESLSQIEEWSADWQAGFSNDVLVSQLIGIWMKGHLMSWTPENAGKWGIALWPEEIATGSESGGGIWVIPKDAPHAAEAAELLAKFSYNPDICKAKYDKGGAIPTLVSASLDEHYLSNDYFGDMSACFKAMENFSVYPYNPASSQELPIVGQYLTEYLNETMDLDAALKAADADLQNQIGNPYQ